MTGRALNRYNAWAAIRKRAKAAGFLTTVGCHTWRATGITIYLENESPLEHERRWEKAKELRDALNDVRPKLMEYADILAEVADVPSLLPQQHKTE